LGRIKKRVTIVGGGIVGLATAYKYLLKYGSDAEVVVLEKETTVGTHQTGNNSGVLHAGLYYKPGSLKALLATSGIKQMTAFCKENNIKHEICGKIVVATDENEKITLKKLLETGTQNGLQGLQWLEGEAAIKTYEPNATGVAAIVVPEEGIVDYRQITSVLQKKIEQLGGSVLCNFKVAAANFNNETWTIEATDGRQHNCDFVITAAGLYSDKIAKTFGCDSDIKIIPFRGDYYMLTDEAKHLVRNLIYPVPDIKYPFLGVHFTRMIDGKIEAGPNAVLAFAREGYTFGNINLVELAESLFFKGLLTFVFKHKALVLDELYTSLSKQKFARRLQKLVPAIRASHIQKAGAGVRAQAMMIDGTLVQDFAIVQNKQSFHVVNAPSPGATASLAIADYILSEIEKSINE
jgi:(S)-2-hydroxyglutarate dehydrogenase